MDGFFTFNYVNIKSGLHCLKTLTDGMNGEELKNNVLIRFQKKFDEFKLVEEETQQNTVKYKIIKGTVYLMCEIAINCDSLYFWIFHEIIKM